MCPYLLFVFFDGPQHALTYARAWPKIFVKRVVQARTSKTSSDFQLEPTNYAEILSAFRHHSFEVRDNRPEIGNFPVVQCLLGAVVRSSLSSRGSCCARSPLLPFEFLGVQQQARSLSSLSEQRQYQICFPHDAHTSRSSSNTSTFATHARSSA